MEEVVHWTGKSGMSYQGRISFVDMYMQLCFIVEAMEDGDLEEAISWLEQVKKICLDHSEKFEKSL